MPRRRRRPTPRRPRTAPPSKLSAKSWAYYAVAASIDRPRAKSDGRETTNRTISSTGALECIEIADARNIDHFPEGDVVTAVAERLQESGVALECLRSALDPRELWRRLGDPARVAADLTYRARTAY
ncbi:hypothetical protein LRP30_40745 [Bradyrhizobium sp. C-145]|uniref:hypothetical protein n=1 Tax=Bradyrhizobium sp. C-145 TaxID=574727 RepID=UPI00201B5390|nr:hypothetical protein [Bradyrhizobium sp. C-145]UQR62998.1 hypothetical protein LRP30_40745 [Bradyrhizobium sp. C-145]